MRDLRSELIKIRMKRGVLTPYVVLEEAQDTAHPLHDRFTWTGIEESDRRWRLVEALVMIRAAFAGSGLLRDELVEPADNPIAQKVSEQLMQRDWAELKQRYAGNPQFLTMVIEDCEFLLPRFGEEVNHDQS